MTIEDKIDSYLLNLAMLAYYGMFEYICLASLKLCLRGGSYGAIYAIAG